MLPVAKNFLAGFRSESIQKRSGVPEGSSAGETAWDAAKSNRRFLFSARAWGIDCSL
jgi:hypothetical protein